MPSDWQDVQRRFYDATADEYDENFQQANPYFAFVLDRFLEAVDPRPGERILELGASGGRFTLPLLDRGCRVTAVDISRRSIEYLERLTAEHPERGSLTLVEDDATTLSRVRGREFDAVVGGLAALLVSSWLVRDDHYAPGAFYALELLPTLGLTVHHVYRVPRCPACSGLADVAPPLPWHKEMPVELAR